MFKESPEDSDGIRAVAGHNKIEQLEEFVGNLETFTAEQEAFSDWSNPTPITATHKMTLNGIPPQ